MTQRRLPQYTSEGLQRPWSWCAQCQRTYVTGTCRIVQFTPDALHPHPAKLKLCPYVDCSASAIRHGWQWATIEREHSDYPAIPERNVVYAR